MRDVGMQKTMKPITIRTPLALLIMLGTGMIMIGLNAFPAAAILIFVAGLLFGIFAVFRSLAALANPEVRRSTGLAVPILTILLATGTWYVVTSTVIHVKKIEHERKQVENKHRDEIHGRDNGTSQPAH